MGSSAAELPTRVRWLAYLIGGFGVGMAQQINFLVPLRARELGASFEVIGLIVAAAALAPAVLSVPLGAAVDRFGAKASFVGATLVTGVVALAMATVDGYWSLLVLQLVIGTGRTGGWLASQAYVTGLGKRTDRASLAGRFGFFGNLGGMLGPLGAGAVAQLVGLQAAFLFLAAYAAVFALLGAFLPGAVEAGGTGRRGQGSGFRNARGLLSVPGIRVALGLTAARLWMSWTWSGFFPVLIVEAGVAPGVAGSVVAFRSLVAMVTAPTTGRWARLGSPSQMTALGLGFGAVGLIVAPFTTVMPWVYLSPLLVGIATGLSLPLLMTIVTEHAPEGQRGTALGLRQSVNGIASAGAPLLVGPLISGIGMTLAFGASGGLAAVVLTLAALAGNRADRRERQHTSGATEPAIPAGEEVGDAAPPGES